MENKIISSKTFRYYTFGNKTKAKYILYALHGYGQLAEFFIRKFHSLPDDIYIVAPEGMHRFYLNGTSGRVGASWMTKEARFDDINDNIQWLNELDRTITAEIQPVKKFILGFSQGGATAARWQQQLSSIDSLIMWASVFPPDLTIKKNIQLNNLSNNHFVLGTNDPYFTEEDQKLTIQFFKENKFKTHTFKGEHTIDQATLNKILTLLKK